VRQEPHNAFDFTLAGGPVKRHPTTGEASGEATGHRLKVTHPDSAADAPLPFATLPHAFNADRRLKGNDKSVLLALTSFAWGDIPECWPSAKAIGERCGLGVQSVRLTLKNLAHFGYIRFVEDDSKASHRRIMLTWRAGEDPLATEPKGALSPRQRESQRVQKRRATTVVEPDVIPVGGLCNLVEGGSCNSTTEEESFKKKQEEDRSHSRTHAHATEPPPVVADEEGKKNEVAALSRNENEEQRHPELTPSQMETAKRHIALGGVLGAMARKRLAAAGTKILPTPPTPHDPCSTARLLPPTLEATLAGIQARHARHMTSGEIKVATARVMEGAKRRGNPEVYQALESLHAGCGHGLVDRAVRLLCRAFKATDAQDMQGAYTQVVRQVEQGERSASCLVTAYEWAAGKNVRNPGAAFKAAIDRWDEKSKAGVGS
jgi:hypothetical protein